jgi:hypothetical protein
MKGQKSQEQSELNGTCQLLVYVGDVNLVSERETELLLDASQQYLLLHYILGYRRCTNLRINETSHCWH